MKPFQDDKWLSAVELTLKELDPDDLTPKQALETLYKLKGLV